jgi:hypothetical protein
VIDATVEVRMRGWFRDPHSGGSKIPEALQAQTQQRLLRHATKNYAGSYARLDIRFRGPFCYIDAYQEPDPAAKPPRGSGETATEFRERLRNTPTHLCRLRYCGNDQWSLAFFTYSHEKYEPCVFGSGSFYGTPEEGLDVGAVYLQG